MVGVLNGKRALVCGASQGIGRACAIELARLGAEVTVVARSEADLKQVVADLGGNGNKDHRWISADFADPQAMQSKIAAHVKEVGTIHILVNNTGGPPHGDLVDAGPEDFLSAISNHVVCNQLLVQTLLGGMKSSGYGRIINIISVSVITPIKGLGVSNTTRGAVANWSRTMAGELGPFGITVNSVLPGYTDTARLQSLFVAKAQKAGTTVDDITRQVVQTVPMERLGDPAEIAAAVGFFASPAASYVTGVNLPVDGGRTAVQ